MRKKRKKCIALILMFAMLGHSLLGNGLTQKYMVKAESAENASSECNKTEENTENTSEYTSEEATSKEIPTTAAVPATEAEKTTVQATTENPFVNPMTDLVVGLLGTNKVSIAFTPVSGIYGYEVSQWMKSLHRFKVIKRLKATSSSFTEKKLNSGSVYTYIVTPYRYVVIDEKRTKVYGEGKKITITTHTKAPKLSIRKAKGQVLFYWNRVPKANGYLIQYSKNNKTFKYLKIISKGGRTSYTRKHMKKGRTYYFRILSYKKIGGVRQFGPASKSKKVKIT